MQMPSRVLIGLSYDILHSSMLQLLSWWSVDCWIGSFKAKKREIPISLQNAGGLADRATWGGYGQLVSPEADKSGEGSFPAGPLGAPVQREYNMLHWIIKL